MILDLIKLNKGDKTPLFRQLTMQLIDFIQKGTLKPGYKLPGSRILARELGVHRKTVVMALEELIIQGWLQTIPGKGTFVTEHIDIQRRNLPTGTDLSKKKAPELTMPKTLQRNLHLASQKYHLDDGLPDPRLAPLDDLARAYKITLTRGNLYSKYTYGDTKGSLYLRKVLCNYLFQSRGMKVNENQILITRGATQALYLCINGLLKSGDYVAVGALNWESANANFLHHGINLIKVRVDREGIDTNHLEELLGKYEIKLIYLTPHHQYPTTVIMPAHRRVKIIQLARKYGFYVFEDDYDYDFHYSTHPLMPLASTEHGDYVIYTGSFTKAISPVFRVGYMVANENQIDFFSRIRRLIDRQGDALLELTIAELLNLGIIQRSLKKNRKIYQHRRDIFTKLLWEYLGNYVSFDVPEGGMSVWTYFDTAIDLHKVSIRALKHDLYITNGSQFTVPDKRLNATRLGFASSNEEELEKSLQILQSIIP